MINPALEEYPEEASLIGRMVVGYGEIDITMVSTAGDAMGMTLPLLDALEEVQSEQRRMAVIRKLAMKSFLDLRLQEEFGTALSAMEECRQVRNYFAHCHYGSTTTMTAGRTSELLVLKAHDLFATERPVVDLPWRRVSVGTLAEQEKYFEHTRKLWMWLQLTLPDRRRGKPDAFDYPGVRSPPPRDAGPWHLVASPSATSPNVDAKSI